MINTADQLSHREEGPLPGRRESILTLERRIPFLSEQTRTQLLGIEGFGKVWQPAQYLPDFSDQRKSVARIREIQRQARLLSPELLFTLIADTLTEEGLPLFSARLYSLHGLPAGEGGDVHAHRGNLQKWFNAWAAEENRHGDLLKAYLTYSGRVDMEAFERSVQLFLEDGMDLQIDGDPYKGFVYTSFQELATQRSHRNVAKIAKQEGDPFLAEICGQVAADEGYHAKAYQAFVRVFFEVDPNGMMQALRTMLERGVVMPAHNMREVDPSGKVLQPGETYARFSQVAQNIGVYTAKDYAEISGELLQAWKVGKKNAGKWEARPMQGLTEEGLEDQRNILRRQRLIEKLADKDRKTSMPMPETSWLVRDKKK